MGKLAIITDGSLTPASAVQPDRIVPFHVNYRDPETGDFGSMRGEQMSVAEFLELQRLSKTLPSTSLVTKVDFLAVLKELIETGADQIVILTVPEGKSGTYLEARKAKEEIERRYPHVEVAVIDTGTTAGGVEYLIEIFNQLCTEGMSFTDILGRLEEEKEKIILFLGLDSIRYVGASGRVPALSEKHWRETLSQFSKAIVSKVVSLVGHSPKVFVTFRHGKEHINPHVSRFLISIVDKISDEIVAEIVSGKRLRKVYLFSPGAKFEGSKIEQKVRNLDGGVEVYVRSDEAISLALYTTAGPKFVAAFCVFE